MLSIEDYAPLVSEVVSKGGTIIWDKRGRPSIARPRPTSKEQWGFNAGAVRKAGELLRWKDKEILYFPKFGFFEYSQENPPVSLFAPHSATVYDHWKNFHKNVQDKILKG